MDRGEGRSNLYDSPDPDRNMAQFLGARVLGVGGGIEGGHHHDVQAGALVGAPERVPSFECAGTGAQA